MNASGKLLAQSHPVILCKTDSLMVWSCLPVYQPLNAFSAWWVLSVPFVFLYCLELLCKGYDNLTNREVFLISYSLQFFLLDISHAS